jgi:hypothetical protein
MAVALWAWIIGHKLAAYYAFSVLVGELPTPRGGSPVYKYIFGVLHIFAANWKRARVGISGKA